MLTLYQVYSVVVNIYIYLSKVLTERFSILYKTQTKEDIKFYKLTLVLVDINLTSAQKFGFSYKNHSTVTGFPENSKISFSGIFVMQSFVLST